MYAVIEVIVGIIVAIILDLWTQIPNIGLYFIIGLIGIVIINKLDVIMILLFGDDTDEYDDF